MLMLVHDCVLCTRWFLLWNLLSFVFNSRIKWIFFIFLMEHLCRCWLFASKCKLHVWQLFRTLVIKRTIFVCRLHMVFSSPRHLMAAGGCIIVMEIVYNMDFSLPGFIICSLILGFGMFKSLSFMFLHSFAIHK